MNSLGSMQRLRKGDIGSLPKDRVTTIFEKMLQSYIAEARL